MSSNPTPPAKAPEAKILQQRAVRTLVAVLIFGGILLALKWYQSHKSDADDVLGGTVISAGMVAAIQYTDDGDYVVAFDAKGQRIDQTGLVKDRHDADPVWRPDGNRVFFVSDRDGKAYQLYRWTPAPNSAAQERSLGSLGKGHPQFSPDTPEANPSMLMVSGGFVVEFDASDLKGHQVLPPQTSGVTQSDEEGGAGSATGQFSGVYGQLGDHFRVARWLKAGESLVGVMGGDHGEVLIVQELPHPGDKLKKPLALATGDRIDFDINPKDGAVVFTVQNFLWTSQAATPAAKRFRHCIGSFKLGDPHPTILVNNMDDAHSFGPPAISPSGDKMLVTEGPFDRTSGTLTPTELLIMPTEGNVSAGVSKLVAGKIYEPSWSPKGDLVAYAKVGDDATRSIYIAGADGGNEHSISGSKGNFGHPLFSPQTK